MAFYNQVKTALLLGALTGLLLLIGGFIGGRTGLLIGLILALAMNFASYWWSAKIVLWMYKAQEADRKEHAHLYSIVKEIAHTAGLPMPKVYIIETPQSNAFATGRNPKNAVVAATTGILQLLTKEELRGVLAHELGHVRNRDILISSIAATIAGIISYVAMIARWGAIFGGLGGRDNNNSGGLMGFLMLAIIAPLMAMIIQLAISRSREYLADETGARLVKDPEALASALEKIEKNVAQHPFQAVGSTQATAHLFISNPFKGGVWRSMFSTHPKTAERCRRLREMKV